MITLFNEEFTSKRCVSPGQYSNLFDCNISHVTVYCVLFTLFDHEFKFVDLSLAALYINLLQFEPRKRSMNMLFLFNDNG